MTSVGCLGMGSRKEAVYQALLCDLQPVATHNSRGSYAQG